MIDVIDLNRTKWDESRVLYKYLDPDGAIKTIAGCSVKCTSPLAFNDPYDTTTEIRLGFDIEDLPEIVSEQIREFVFGQRSRGIAAPTKLGAALLQVRRMRKSLDRNVKLDLAMPSVRVALDEMKSQLAADQDSWREFLGSWRIYCLSARKDNLLLWAHYADKHRGAVIGFRCVPDLDSCFCVAHPVSYCHDIPVIATPDEWFDHVTGMHPLDVGEKFMEMTLTKGKDWQYEEEYRYMLPALDPHAGSDHDIREIAPEELDSVYMGCKMLPEDRKAILEAAATRVPHARVYQAVQSHVRYGLDFDLVS